MLLYTEVITFVLLFPTGIYSFPVLRKNDGNQGLLALELRGQNQ